MTTNVGCLLSSPVQGGDVALWFGHSQISATVETTGGSMNALMQGNVDIYITTEPLDTSVPFSPKHVLG